MFFWQTLTYARRCPPWPLPVRSAVSYVCKWCSVSTVTRVCCCAGQSEAGTQCHVTISWVTQAGTGQCCTETRNRIRTKLWSWSYLKSLREARLVAPLVLYIVLLLYWQLEYGRPQFIFWVALIPARKQNSSVSDHMKTNCNDLPLLFQKIMASINLRESIITGARGGFFQ